MTNQEHFLKLYNEYKKTNDGFFNADKELSTQKDFGNFLDVPKYLKMEKELRAASEKYYEFLDYARKNKIDPSADFIG